MGFVFVHPYSFLAFTVCGIAIGIVYCVLNSLGSEIKKYRVVRALLDIIFWLVTIAVFLICTWLSTSGSFRLFALLAYLLGALVSVIGPGRYIGSVIKSLIKLTKGGIGKINKLFEQNTDNNSEIQ